MTLRNEEFCKALAISKAEIALKMPLKLMSVPDWEELLKIARSFSQNMTGCLQRDTSSMHTAIDLGEETGIWN